MRVYQPYDHDQLWMKARLFINRAMDDARSFDEQAFWSSAAFELLGKAALAKHSPLLIANPADDGKSLLAASGLTSPHAGFSTIPAKALWSRCERAFKPFSQADAVLISGVRNDYLHAGRVGMEGTAEAWWPRFWAQAEVLLRHYDRTIEEFVGRNEVATVEAHLATNREYKRHRLQALIERARQRLSLHGSGNLSVELDRAWKTFSPADYSNRIAATCPACGEVGVLGGEEVLGTRVEYLPGWIVMERGESDIQVWKEIASDGFSCVTCHLELYDFELLESAGLDLAFEVEGDPSDYYDEVEYNNE